MTGAPGITRDTVPVLAVVPHEPSKRLIRTLEELLEMAKEGELRSLAYIFIRRGNVAGIGARGERLPTPILGQLPALERELLRYVERDDVEVAFDE